MSPPLFRLELENEAATIRLAEDIAARLRTGDIVALDGNLGAGKTALARALIRAIADDHALEVPSPTFTIVQTYPLRIPVAHFDLYRIGSADELDELGFDEAVAENAVLIEWPARAGSRLPGSALQVKLEIAGAGRIATIAGNDDWRERLERSFAIRHFLERAGWLYAHRRHLQGDASTRVYERIANEAASAVLMDAPERGPGPMLADGRSYDAVAHRATSVRPFVAMGEAIRQAGFSAPAILSADMPAGLLLLEDLGSEGVTRDGEPDFERYAVAAEVLAEIHAVPRPRKLPLPDGSLHLVPPFDADAFAIEVDLLPRWYAPHVLGRPLGAAAEAEFAALWARLFERFDRAQKSWLLRDYHSPNLLWLRHREGPARIGILDHQDAMYGASAYDLASLGQDVRVSIEPGFESALVARYCARRHALGAFDEAAFMEAYAISGAQRTTKVLGGFARLAASAGKPQYLRHIPRVLGYLRRNFRHPVLSELALWYDRYLPADDDAAPSGSL